MSSITVDSRIFDFPDGWLVMKYDATPYYREKFQGRTKGTRGLKREMKAVDLIATNPAENEPILYLIESKDYRLHPRKKKESPVDEFVKKVMDTLTGILPTALCSDSSEHGEDCLRSSLRCATKLRLIYQFEQPNKESKLFPVVFDLADLQTKIRQELQVIDPEASVIDVTNQELVPWNVR